MEQTAFTTEPPPSLYRGYAGPAHLYDEMCDPSGALRPSYHMFVTLLDDLGPKEIRRRWEQARRLIHENGVTYNVYGDPQGMDRPWNLDTIPFLVSAEQWSHIESGLNQRGKLLDLILADLYGPQQLLSDNLLPPELVYSHPNFLRPCHGIKPPGNRWLHMYAADIGRAPDGGFLVIGDRTQAPSGAGYALENRLVLSRALPDVFRDCRVERLATFFRDMRDMLGALAPHHKENPRIVLLTPGPYNETYFEHAYLARYLGFTLVEGGDLTVRDDAVFLKTLSGLQPVDVILRRQDDDFCDPLELRSDSALGVPGLVQSIRAGNVAVANALGSGISETPALMPFLPALCKHILGEELLLQSVNSWWCGDPQSLQHVISNLHRLVIKPAFPPMGNQAVFAESLSRDELQKLRDRIMAEPIAFVAEEQLQLSTAPVLVDQKLQPRHLVLRAHLVARGEGYSVMPGGLARFSGTAESLVVSMQKGGGSKDTWVLAGGPVNTFSLLQPTGTQLSITRAGGDLPSRIADNLFWLGRYIERADSVARLGRVILTRATDQYGAENSPELTPLLDVLVRLAEPEEYLNGFPRGKAKPLTGTDARFNAIFADPRHPHGLQARLRSVHRLASVVRDRISIDTWRIVNSLEREFMKPITSGQMPQSNELLPALDRIIITFAAFGGLAMESMTRGHAWRFLDMGRRIERALYTTNLLRGTMVDTNAIEGPIMEAVLEVADSSMTYRRRYLTSLQPAAILDLLLADETNPRSVAFQLAALSSDIDELPRASTASSPRRSPEERLILRGLTAMRLIDIQQESEIDEPTGRRQRLDDLLDCTAQILQDLSNTLSQSYLAHATLSRQLGTSTAESP
jgi:uncharacterized circularly permuted ATP-grasp superfamily protein/uncharacterized alpha-E superfamily protein